MGLFDFLKKPSHLTLSLKEYGHASADWSINLAPSLAKSISQCACAPQGSSSLALSIKGSPFTAQVIFTGLYAACYLVYATHYLKFSQDATSAEKIRDGLMDGLLALNYPPQVTTNKEKEGLANYILDISIELADAIVHDIQVSNPRQEILYTLVVGRFNKAFKPKNGFSENELFILQPLIMSVRTDLFMILMNTHKRMDNSIQIQLPIDC